MTKKHKETEATLSVVEKSYRPRNNKVGAEKQNQSNYENLCSKFLSDSLNENRQHQLKSLNEPFHQRVSLRKSVGGRTLSKTQFLAGLRHSVGFLYAGFDKQVLRTFAGK